MGKKDYLEIPTVTFVFCIKNCNERYRVKVVKYFAVYVVGICINKLHVSIDSSSTLRSIYGYKCLSSIQRGFGPKSMKICGKTVTKLILDWGHRVYFLKLYL